MSNSLTSQFQQINKLIKKGKNILIASHENPDPDAVGSTLALHLALQKKGLKSFCYLSTSPPKKLNFLPGFFEIKENLPLEILDPQLIFGLDYGDFRRLRLPDFFSEKKFITIDHHQGDQRGEIKIVRPDFSSTAEILYLFLENSGIEIDKDIATSILAGITYDTGLFSHTCTSPRTMEIVSNLLLKGAPLTEIIRGVAQFSFPTLFNASQIKIWGRALSRVKFDPKTGLVYSFVSFSDLKECQISSVELGDISSIILNIFPAKFSLFLSEYEKGKIKGSLRSEPVNGERVDLIAQALGGGGHPYAAGFKQEGTIEEVLKKVIDLIE